MDLRNQKCMSLKTTEKLKMDIFDLNNTQMFKWKYKLQFLCNGNMETCLEE